MRVNVSFKGGEKMKPPIIVPSMQPIELFKAGVMFGIAVFAIIKEKSKGEKK